MTSDPQLTLRDRRELRARVLLELDHLDEQIGSLSRGFDDIVDATASSNTDDEHDPEGSTIAFERAQISALLRQAQEDRAAMRAALDRLDESGYGMCEHCHGFIGVERLLTLPSATRCVGCAR